jgi:hypothetical protein
MIMDGDGLCCWSRGQNLQLKLPRGYENVPVDPRELETQHGFAVGPWYRANRPLLLKADQPPPRSELKRIEEAIRNARLFENSTA